MRRNIDFDSGNLFDWKARDLFRLLNVGKLPVFQVEVDYDVDERTADMYIYIENGDETEWREDTFKFAQSLSARGFDATLSDEDYECDVVIVTFNLADYDEFFKLKARHSSLKKMQWEYKFGQRASPRPTSTPYDREIKVIGEKLEEFQ